ncbi:MAG: phage tail sheath family protein [Steroidobacteraceae bacterium]|nr:phage tail sheath family protein [Steroidobacteraceae bacterium]
MAEHFDSQISSAEEPGSLRVIARAATNIAAFVGRALKGPVNEPVPVRSFADYTRMFGGLWQPSSLSYAVEQFFENGGRCAIIVRVVNGASPPTLTLPTTRGRLTLRGVGAGSREFLRASVDYDAIDAKDHDRFNLVVQRVRTAGSEQIEDQEIFRRLSVTPGHERFVADALLESRLVRVQGIVPAERPARTPAANNGAVIGYTPSNPDGDDGGPITDYDIIGSAQLGTGIFALQAAPDINLLCIPPLTRDQDVGLSTLLVAGRFCRERRVMLICDPPSEWASSAAALDGMRHWPFRSEDAAMFYPRIVAFDRLRGRFEMFAPCGVAAGMIARCDETWPVWSAAEGEDAILRPGLRPAWTVSHSDRTRLMTAGINLLQSVRVPPRLASSPRTLASGSAAVSDWRYLSARRLALFVMTSIERGTRWMLFERNTPAMWTMARAQVEAFLDSLYAEGAFSVRAGDASYFAVCDDRINTEETARTGKVNLAFGFAASKPGEFHAFLVTHSPDGSRTRPITVNRFANYSPTVDEDIESSILRGLAAGPAPDAEPLHSVSDQSQPDITQQETG